MEKQCPFKEWNLSEQPRVRIKQAQESKILKVVVSVSPKVTESGKCSQAWFCWWHLKTQSKNKLEDIHVTGVEMVVELGMIWGLLLPSLLRRFLSFSRRKMEAWSLSTFLKSIFQGLKNRKDQIAIYLGLFLTSGASGDTLKELIYWIPNWIGLRELIQHPRWQIYSLPMNCIRSIIFKALFHLGRKLQHKSHSFQ